MNTAETKDKIHPITKARAGHADIIETVLAKGDLAALTVEERNRYYLECCRSLGLNPLTRPFEYITLQGRMILYARRDCADQVRRNRGVSITGMEKEVVEGVYVVSVEAKDKDARTDRATGAVAIANLKGDALANAMMKAETKAKRRVTLSLCGLGLIDETEVEDIQRAEKGKTLPKAKAKPIYEQLNKELLAFPTDTTLLDWLNNQNTLDRIAVLPEDWQDLLRLDAKAQLAALRIKGGDKQLQQASADVEAVMTPKNRGGEIIDGNLEMPEWVREMDAAFWGCEDFVSLGAEQVRLMVPMKDSATDEEWALAEEVFAQHIKRIEG